jgi:non-ribosomal peptide synthetase component F
MTVTPDVKVVPYGVDSWPIEELVINRTDDGALRVDASFPCAAIDKNNRKPLRLNSEVFSVASNFNAPQGATPLTVLSDHLKGLCRTWDRLSLRFLDGYFAHIATMLGVHRDAIAVKLAPFAGLYAAEDWTFSAPKPLPRAHLYAPRNNSASWVTEDFMQVDFAFWLGDRMVAVLSKPGSLTPARANERVARLEQAGVTTVHFTAQDLEKEPVALFDRIIGDFGALIEGAGVVPISPFRPRMSSE